MANHGSPLNVGVRFEIDEGSLKDERRKWKAQRQGFLAMLAAKRVCTSSPSQRSLINGIALMDSSQSNIDSPQRHLYLTM